MKLNANILMACFACLLLSACASTTKLDRELVHQEKIKTINLNQMPENISIQEADNTTTSAVAGGLVGVIIGNAIDSNINSKRRKALEPFIEMLAGLDVNKVLMNALDHNLTGGKAFSEEIAIETFSSTQTEQSYLVPVVSPSVVMLADYSGVLVGLAVSTPQEQTDKRPKRYNSFYSSKNTMDDELQAKREENKAFWNNNSLLLREKIVDGLYDVAKQFANDYNSDQAE